jgi:DNA-binding GntR family transcriptional regulator
MAIERAPEPQAIGAARDGRLAADVHDRLRAAILEGSIEPGATMSQTELAESLDVGRTPLREALRLLHREGLVVSEPNRRVAIAPLTSADAEDLYIMRIALEVAALRLTVATLESRDLAELEGLMAQMSHFQRVGDMMSINRPHRAFHLRLVAGAGPRGAAAIADLFDHAKRYRLANGLSRPDRWPERQAEHRALLDAVTAHDVPGAVRALAAHYTRTAINVFDRLDPGYQPVRLRTTLAAVAPGTEDLLGR